MSFYRIYRPQVIDEIDNLSVRESLLRLLEKPKKDLPHAFLFSGPRGAGKTTAARLIAKLFNCMKPSKKGPCGECEQCVTIAEGKNLDIFEIDAASNRGIDEMRTLRDGINLSPVSAPYKVYIIDEVHMLTTEAFNALLKTLEEPPSHAVFVLATTDPQKVPVTIKSRCISMVFSKATAEELTHALKRIVEKEKMTIDDAALSLIATGVDGSFRDGVKFLEQVSFFKGNITPDAVRSILAISEDKVRVAFLHALASKNAKAALLVVSALAHEGKDIKSFIVEVLRDCETQFIALATGGSVDGWDAPGLSACIRKLSTAFVEMKSTAITELPLELAIVEFCNDSVDTQKTSSASHVAESTPQATGQIPNTTTATTGASVPPVVPSDPPSAAIGMLSLSHLTNHWVDVIAELKLNYHSVAGVLRSTRPKSVGSGIVVIEAFYTFHKDKLSEPKTKEILSSVLKKLFGEKVKIEVVLGKSNIKHKIQNTK